MEDGGFEFWDAAQTPGRSNNAVDKNVLQESGWGKLEEKLATERFVGPGLVAGNDMGFGTETVLQGISRRTSFALRSAGTRGMRSILTINEGTIL